MPHPDQDESLPSPPPCHSASHSPIPLSPSPHPSTSATASPPGRRRRAISSPHLPCMHFCLHSLPPYQEESSFPISLSLYDTGIFLEEEPLSYNPSNFSTFPDHTHFLTFHSSACTTTTDRRPPLSLLPLATPTACHTCRCRWWSLGELLPSQVCLLLILSFSGFSSLVSHPIYSCILSISIFWIGDFGRTI